jgi:hypothetical protein
LAILVTRIKSLPRIGVALAAALLLTALTVTPVNSHSSSYCGHYKDGVLTKTVFLDSHKHYISDAGGSIVGWEHHHKYGHGPHYYPPYNHIARHKKCNKH